MSFLVGARWLLGGMVLGGLATVVALPGGGAQVQAWLAELAGLPTGPERLLARRTSLLRARAERSALSNAAAGEYSEGDAAAGRALQQESLAVGAGGDEEPRIVATARSIHIFEAPSFSARKIGYLRAGESVVRSEQPVAQAGCSGGFYAVQPTGFVCAGKTASPEAEHPARQHLGQRPDRDRLLPYAYGVSAYPPPHLYSRVPTYGQRAAVEHDLNYHLRHPVQPAWEAGDEPGPRALLEEPGYAPTFDGGQQIGANLVLGKAIANSSFAFVKIVEDSGYAYGLTTDLELVPLDRVAPVRESHFRGVAIEEGQRLPLAFVRSHNAMLLGGHPARRLEELRPARHREAVYLSGRSATRAGASYRETLHGQWLRESELVVIEPLADAPSWVQPGVRWIDVSVLRQTLVAYNGLSAEFATLVSTGLGDGPEGDFSTVYGVFRIHAKHVTVHMGSNGDEGAGAYDFRDVPYVQYFYRGFALHAAHWHDAFGAPRSHGCVNLSPADARWLFGWTMPPVPEEWHGAQSAEGTRVYIHP